MNKANNYKLCMEYNAIQQEWNNHIDNEILKSRYQKNVQQKPNKKRDNNTDLYIETHVCGRKSIQQRNQTN